jgi:hypothetical protein
VSHYSGYRPSLHWSQRLGRALGPVIVTAAVALMVWWIWPRVPEPIVDYGREVYVPWRLVSREVLYEDIHFFNGPLSAYAHAGLFKYAGVSLVAIKLFNALIVWIGAMLIYRIVRAMGDRWAATCAGVTFAVMFACQQIGGATFNFITPYSYELPHGVVLSLGMILCQYRAVQSRKHRVAWTALAGFLLGLVFLTKAEVFLAALVSAVVGIACLLRAREMFRRDALEVVGLFLVYAIAPVIVATTLLTLAMPITDVLSGLAGAWKWIGDARLTSMPYFRLLMGTDQPRQSLTQMLNWTGGYLLVLAPAAVVGWVVGRRTVPTGGYDVITRGGIQVASSTAHGGAMPFSAKRKITLIIALVLALLTAAALLLGSPALLPQGLRETLPRPFGHIAWDQILRPLPLLVLVIAGGIGQLLWREPRYKSAWLALPAAFTAFAGVLLAKILLNVHAYHYGFALAMPACMLLVTAVVAWVARWVGRGDESHAAAAWIPRATALAIVAVVIFVHVRITGILLSRRTFQVGVPGTGDVFLAEPGGTQAYGQLSQAALEDLRRMTRRTDTLVTIPDGLMLNYLARRANPTGYLNFTPPALVMFGESNMVAAFDANPPDWVLLCHTDTSVYDARFFGVDYGRELMRWIDERYDVVKQYGAKPFTSDQPGLLLMKRRVPTTK